MNEFEVNEFLYYGFLPSRGARPDSIFSRLDALDDGPSIATAATADADAALLRGRGVWNKVIDTLLERDAPPGPHVLPLSGGFDSRAILGALLDRYESKDITAVTFGTPGTWDFELGRRIAKTCGVDWHGIDLTGDGWSWRLDSLLETAAAAGGPNWVFDACVYRHFRGLFPPTARFWSGFYGDSSTGKHLSEPPVTTWEQAKTRFAKDFIFVESPYLPRPGWDPVSCLPSAPLEGPERIGYYDQLDLGLKEDGLTRDTVLSPGYMFEAPFFHPLWLSFVVRLPFALRKRQAFYRTMLTTTYPSLFSLPTKTDAGLTAATPAWRVDLRRARIKATRQLRGALHRPASVRDKRTNYVDFDKGLRERDDLEQVVGECVTSLKGRGIVEWLDLDDLWNTHLQGRRDNGVALTLLAALEIQLRVEERAGRK